MGDTGRRKAQAFSVFLLVLPCKVHPLLSSPRLSLCKFLLQRVGPELCRSSKNFARLAPSQAICLFFPRFSHLAGDSCHPSLSSSPWPSKESSRARAHTGQPCSHSCPTAARSVGKDVPLLWQPMGCRALVWGRTRKTASLVHGGQPKRQGRRSGCSCPRCSFGQFN